MEKVWTVTPHRPHSETYNIYIKIQQQWTNEIVTQNKFNLKSNTDFRRLTTIELSQNTITSSIQSFMSHYFLVLLQWNYFCTRIVKQKVILWFPSGVCITLPPHKIHIPVVTVVLIQDSFHTVPFIIIVIRSQSASIYR